MSEHGVTVHGIIVIEYNMCHSNTLILHDVSHCIVSSHFADSTPKKPSHADSACYPRSHNASWFLHFVDWCQCRCLMLYASAPQLCDWCVQLIAGPVLDKCSILCESRMQSFLFISVIKCSSWLFLVWEKREQRVFSYLLDHIISSVSWYWTVIVQWRCTIRCFCGWFTCIECLISVLVSESDIHKIL